MFPGKLDFLIKSCGVCLTLMIVAAVVVFLFIRSPDRTDWAGR